MKVFKLLVSLALTLVIIQAVQAQQPQDSTALDRYIELGIQNNLNLVNEALEVDRSRSQLREARGQFMPDVSFESTYSFADGGRTIDIPVGDLFNPVHGALNQLTSQQQFPTGLQNMSEQLLPNNYHETKLRIIQPLFNTDIYYGYRAQQHMVSQQEARRRAVEDELVKEIKVGYFNYLKTARLLDIYQSTLELFREMVRVNQRLVENGKATKDAIYTAEFEFQQLKSDLSEARQKNATARAYFNFLLNRKLEAPILQDSIRVSDSRKLQELSMVQEQAMSLRPEFDQIDQGISANKELLKLSKGNALPEVFVVGDVGYQGFEYKFNNKQDFWFVQFGLRWKLFGGFQNRERIQQSRIDIKKLENRQSELKQQVRLRLIDTWHALEAARTTLQSKHAGLRAAESSFRIIKQKYHENTALLIEYIEAQNNLTTARLEYTIARYNLLARKAELERAAGWTGKNVNY